MPTSPPVGSTDLTANTLADLLEAAGTADGLYAYVETGVAPSSNGVTARAALGALQTRNDNLTVEALGPVKVFTTASRVGVVAGELVKGDKVQVQPVRYFNADKTNVFWKVLTGTYAGDYVDADEVVLRGR